ncbi:MAG: L-threonylcarbamoyladenylate synthase [Candidatus Cryptobacteroides sp.]
MEMIQEIGKALEVLRNGGVILYPTDTVWGIGCDATNPEAVAKVYQIKNRPDSKSLVLLASDLDMVCRYVREIPEMAVQLVEVNDKPMTIIYPGAISGPAPDDSGAMPKADRGCLAYNVVAEDGSVGIRIPMMDFCRQLASRLGRPLVSTSANISGEPTPKDFGSISPKVKEAVDLIVDPALAKGASGHASSIIKVGLDATIEIIRK